MHRHLITAALAFALACGSANSAIAAGPAESSNPTGGDMKPEPPLSLAERKVLAAKDAEAARGEYALATPPASKDALRLRHAMQQTTYWCGPATGQMMLSSVGSAHRQSDLAKRFGTGRSGTDGANMADALTVLLEHEGYNMSIVRVPVPGGGGTAYDLAAFQTRMVRALTNPYNYAPAVSVNLTSQDMSNPKNAAKIPASYRRKFKELHHLTAVAGYRNTGASLRIADPAGSSDSKHGLYPGIEAFRI